MSPNQLPIYSVAVAETLIAMVSGEGQVRPISFTMSKTSLLLKASRNHHTFRLFFQTYAHIDYATVTASDVRSATCTVNQLVTNDQASS